MKKLLLLLIAVPLASAEAATRVIVEFHGAPAAIAGPRIAAAQRETHERFRRDLRRAIVSQSNSAAPRPQIRHEYSVVFFGAAVDLEPADIARIRELPYVCAVHRDREVRTLGSATQVIDARTRVNAVNLPTRGKDITIAIIDTGIDYMHADLGRGFGPGFKVAGGYDFVNGDADPMDDHGHGTHVAGIAAANGPELLGVAPDATLIAYKSLSAGGGGSEATVLAAIERSADPNGDGDFSDHHDVANLSLGAPGMADDPLSRAVDNASAAGVIVVAGAGNEGGSIVSIGTPGTARDAITVGAHDADGVVADFSSRGPTPGLLTFKPDVVAPGVGIFSAKHGGGLIAFGGTSMATPHVAGICALLRSLHPDWTPADVKAALVSTALPVDATAFVRGAGRVDAQRAHEAKIFVRGAGLSFGLAPSSTGTLEATRTFRIENRSTAEQAFELVAPSVPNGITLTVTPATFTVPPGESRSVEVRLVLDNVVVPFADDQHQRLLGGAIAFTGSTPVAIPWGIVRSARIAVRSATALGIVKAYREGEPFHRILRMYRLEQAELFVKPGSKWDLAVTSFDLVDNAEVIRMTFLEDRSVSGDESITISPADAPLRIHFDGRDASGIPLASRPRGPYVLRRTAVNWKRESAGRVDENEFSFETLGGMFVSPASTRFTLTALETLIDLEEMDAYIVQHETLRGFSEAKTLRRDASSMTHARFALEPVGTSLAVCTVSGDLRLLGSSFRRGPCVERRERPSGTLDYFATEDVEPLVVSGIQIQTGHVITPALRVYEGDIVATWNATPSAAAMRIPNGGTATIAAGPVYPYAIPGTTGGMTTFHPSPGFFGALDDMRVPGNTWVSNGSTFVVTREGLVAAGHPSRGVLEVSFGSNADDLEPPTLTSLRIVDQTTLRFSAADFDYRKAMETKVWKPEATRAWVRQTGTLDWRPLSLVSEGSETGNLNTMRHTPSGDLYRADLSSAATAPNALFDLRIDLEDAAGNRATWTQSPAFSNGTVAAPPRRRSVR